MASKYWASKGARAFFATSYKTNTRPFATHTKESRILREHWQRRGVSYNRGFNYQRFQQSRGLLHRWAAQPTFYYQVGAIATVCGGFYIVNLEEVPVGIARARSDQADG